MDHDAPVNPASEPDPMEALRRENERLRMELYELRRGEEAARDVEQRLRRVIDHAPVVVWATDRDGVFTLSEGSGLEALGLKPGQVVGMSARDLYGRDAPRIYENMVECLKGRSINDVVRVGDLVYESLYVPRRNEKGEVIGTSGVAWDVTQRVRAEEAARALEGQLVQAQKMETIGTLAGGIAHDFNNILSPILGYTDIAMSQLPDGHPVRADLEQVLLAARRAKELVGQILIFSRRGKETARPVQLHLVAHEALKLLRSSLPSSIEISQRIASQGDTILADPARMHQVIMNLCTNAAFAMRENGGVLRVELGPETIDGKTAGTVPGLSPGRHVVLTVRDDGEGMDAATMARVFEPFFTTKEPGEGTGLGMSVVHGIVHQLGGAIGIESRPGKGTTVRVYLPATEDEAASEEEPASGEIGVGGEHILVVDDEPEIARMLDRMLSARGFRVTAFTSAPSALDAFRAAPTAFAALITDQTMPRMSGLELARKIHAHRPDLPVILTTGYAGTTQSAEFARDIAAVAVKPFDTATLIRTLREALDRE